MNLQNILNGLSEVDGELYDRLAHVSRRKLFSLGKKAALAAAPLAFASTLNKAYGQTVNNMPDRTVEVLKFALLLEYLEAEFYNIGLSTPGLIPAQDRPVFEQIAKHENAHVNFLRTALGSMAEPKPRFDFTARGQYPTVFSNYQTFLALSQAFEDTGVRAYKGQAGNLVSNSAVLQAALQIHSVEARHAAHIRRMRRDMPNGVATNKPWITLKDRGGLPNSAALPLQNIYDGEEIVTQADINLTSMNSGGVSVSANAASEAFDEPLTKEQVTVIVTPFLR